MGIVESCPSGRYQEGERVLLWGFDRGLFQEYVLAGDEASAMAAFEKAVVADPGYAKARQMLAQLYRKQGRSAEARKVER